MKVGIDIGGTSVKITFCDDYKIIHEASVPTHKETLIKDIANYISYYFEKNNQELESIGIGVPGVVINNYVYTMPNIGLKNFNIAEAFNEYFPGVKIRAVNDANAAAMGEKMFNNKHHSIYFITLGTGVGGGLIIDDKLVEGSHGACGEIGHMHIDEIYQFECGCGLKGCLETVASARGLIRLAKFHYNDFETSLKEDELTAASICDAAKVDDPLASYVFNIYCRYLARAFANIAVATDIEAIYIGGGVSLCGSFLVSTIKKYYQEYAYQSVKNTDIVLAQLKDKAGALGAAYL